MTERWLFVPVSMGLGWDTHLYLQLLYHLHLDSTLGRAPVIKCMFCVEVSGEENTEVWVGLGMPSTQPLCWGHTWDQP